MIIGLRNVIKGKLYVFDGAAGHLQTNMFF
jgi:hypothetical protein